MNYGIVVIAFERADSLKRLLNSLANVEYFQDNIALIISIDKGDNDRAREVAQNFLWCHGNKIVLCQEENLGLRNHVIKCGNYLNQYNLDAIAVLEDDIVVSPGLYNYMRQVVPFFGQDNRIAGISLYTHLWYIPCERPFVPQPSVYDNFFMKYAQSWGQIWVREQWNAFYSWYKNQNGEFEWNVNLPRNLRGWSNSSWLKYHIKYCVENDKYFAYPYISLTTNCAEVGVNYTRKDNSTQVPMLVGGTKSYNLIDLEHCPVRYDQFWEREGLEEAVGLPKESLEIDLYGFRNENQKRYLLTMEHLNKKIIKSYRLEFRPHEYNILANNYGNDIFLYDMQVECQNKYDKDVKLIKWIYDFRKPGTLKKLWWKLIWNALKNKMRK